jgi:hypothetical protein
MDFIGSIEVVPLLQGRPKNCMTHKGEFFRRLAWPALV